MSTGSVLLRGFPRLEVLLLVDGVSPRKVSSTRGFVLVGFCFGGVSSFIHVRLRSWDFALFGFQHIWVFSPREEVFFYDLMRFLPSWRFYQTFALSLLR